MKNLYSLILFCIAGTISAQEPTKAEPSEFYKSLNEKFTETTFLNKKCIDSDGPVSDPIAFNKIYQEIFSTVVLGSSDVITNGSAFAYTLDNVKNTFSINGTTKAKSLLVDLGLSIKNKDNSFNYYQNNAWATDITIKAGLIIPFGNGSLFYMTSDCEDSNKSRMEYFKNKIDSIIAKTAELVIVNRRIEILNNLPKDKKENLLNVKTGYEDLDKKIYLWVDGNIEAFNIETILSQEKKKKSDIESILKWNENEILALRDKYKNQFDSSDEGKKSYKGYSARWMNTSFSYTNSSIKLENGSILDENIEHKYRSISKGSLNVNFNYQLLRADNALFLFLNVGQRLNRLSYLDNVDFTGKKFTIELNSTGDAYNVKAEEIDSSIGSYHDLHDAVVTTDTYINFGLIPKSTTNFLGVLGKFSVAIPVEGNDHNYTKNYTALIGPIIRLTRDKAKTFSAATFSILSGFENTGFNKNAWDLFLVKASAAIPFNVFEKKSK